jgi:hypothetical protein
MKSSLLSVLMFNAVLWLMSSDPHPKENAAQEEPVASQ